MVKVKIRNSENVLITIKAKELSYMCGTTFLLREAQLTLREMQELQSIKAISVDSSNSHNCFIDMEAIESVT